jgi:hypothetical protein
MTLTRSRLWIAAALAAATALAFGHAARAADPSLYANYASNCTFAFVGDAGTAVASVPPGTYQLVVDTPFAFSNGLASCEFVQFHLTGPGINVDTDLGSGDSEVEQHTITLQAGGTYTVQDDGRPAQTRRTFTVATSGSAASTGNSTKTSSSSSTKGGTPSKDLVGSAIGPLRGSLEAAVSKAGKLTLQKSKQSVSSLKSGRYTFRVADSSSKAGFVVQLVKSEPTTVSSAKFTGTRAVTVNLTPGQWFFSTPGGTRHPFIVTR